MAKRKKSKAQFYITVIGIGIVLSVAVFFAVLMSMLERDVKDATKSIAETTKPVAKPIDNNNKEITSISESAKIITTIGVIENITNNKISIYDIKNNSTLHFELSSKTELRDSYGTLLVIAEFKNGDVVNVEYEDNTNIAKSVKKNSNTWDYKNVKNIVHDDISKTLKINNQYYDYTNKTVVTYNDEPYDINKISPYDTVDVHGYSQTIYSINVTKGHGYLDFVNKDAVKNGIIEVDTDVIVSLLDFITLPLEEGTHQLVVKGSNIEPFSTEINITNNEVLNYDLENAQSKAGLIIFDTNVDDYTVMIDFEKAYEPLILDYGTYDVAIQKDLYETHVGQLVVNNKEVVYKAKLNKIVQLTSLQILTVPDGANVYIDNVLVGQSPVEKKVEYGEHKIAVSKEGYIEVDLDIVTKEKKEAYRFPLILKE